MVRSIDFASRLENERKYAHERPAPAIGNDNAMILRSCLMFSVDGLDSTGGFRAQDLRSFAAIRSQKPARLFSLREGEDRLRDC